MARPNRLPDALRASALSRPPQACATRRRADVHGVRRRANNLRGAGRGAVACRTARPACAVDDASASEGES
ncbi:hypothetical protein BFF94_004295 [Burkholderia catarinensis]|nr:hypothetical protein BFF94_004295 [Burkholderia catarinensis]